MIAELAPIHAIVMVPSMKECMVMPIHEAEMVPADEARMGPIAEG
jgi:hypothetical protein